jgi:hypothetical protein
MSRLRLASPSRSLVSGVMNLTAAAAAALAMSTGGDRYFTFTVTNELSARPAALEATAM